MLQSNEISILGSEMEKNKDGLMDNERREFLFEQDDHGRTPLFYAAEKGLEEEVSEMIFSLRGTGLSLPRLKLITTKDHSGLTAADVAEENGHKEIARLLRVEQGRMEYFE